LRSTEQASFQGRTQSRHFLGKEGYEEDLDWLIGRCGERDNSRLRHKSAGSNCARAPFGGTRHATLCQSPASRRLTDSTDVSPDDGDRSAGRRESGGGTEY